MNIPKLGWLPDVPDQRDYVYKAPSKALRLKPTSIDLRLTYGMPPVYTQGNLGSCVSQAVGSCLQFLQLRQRRKSFISSRLFLYYNARLIDGTTNYDAGTYIRSGIKAANRYGGPMETLWPYVIPKFTTQPTQNVYVAGEQNQLLLYQRIPQRYSQIEARLYQGFPIVLGIAVYESFLNSISGKIMMPARREKLVGGHAIVIVGYNSRKLRFICRNSWGINWGMNGYFTIPYQYIANPNLSEDLWTVQLIE